MIAIHPWKVLVQTRAMLPVITMFQMHAKKAWIRSQLQHRCTPIFFINTEFLCCIFAFPPVTDFLLLDASMPMCCVGFGQHKTLDMQAASYTPRFNNKSKDPSLCCKLTAFNWYLLCLWSLLFFTMRQEDLFEAIIYTDKQRYFNINFMFKLLIWEQVLTMGHIMASA